MRQTSRSLLTASWEMALPTHQRTTRYAATLVAKDGVMVVFDVSTVLEDLYLRSDEPG